MSESVTSPQLRFPHWLVLIGVALIVLALVLVTFRYRFTATPTGFSEPNTVTSYRNEHAEVTLWCFAGVAAVLGVGVMLVGLVRWPVK